MMNSKNETFEEINAHHSSAYGFHRYSSFARKNFVKEEKKNGFFFWFF